MKYYERFFSDDRDIFRVEIEYAGGYKRTFKSKYASEICDIKIGYRVNLYDYKGIIQAIYPRV